MTDEPRYTAQEMREAFREGALWEAGHLLAQTRTAGHGADREARGRWPVPEPPPVKGPSGETFRIKNGVLERRIDANYWCEVSVILIRDAATIAALQAQQEKKP